MHGSGICALGIRAQFQHAGKCEQNQFIVIEDNWLMRTFVTLVKIVLILVKRCLFFVIDLPV